MLITIAAVVAVGLARAIDLGSLARLSAHHPAAAPAPADLNAPATSTAAVAPLRGLQSADVLLTSATTIPAEKVTDISQLPEIKHTEAFRYGTVDLAGNKVPAYGVDPSTFRSWAVQATAASDGFWRSVAGGEAAASFQTAKDLDLPLGAHLPIGARSSESMRLGSFATVGLPDAEAVLSDARAAQIGLPQASGLLISAPDADLRTLTSTLSAVLGPGVAVRPLKPLPPAPVSDPVPLATPAPTATTNGGVAPGAGLPEQSGSVGSVSAPASASAAAVIQAAESKIGAPYVYGASGPDAFDCSGFTSWVYRQVGIGLPRTAQEQWLSGTQVSYADARPGDILAWAGDPSAPNYVTHVAIYLGNGQMISAPHSGTTVGISSVYTSGLLGAVRILP